MLMSTGNRENEDLVRSRPKLSHKTWTPLKLLELSQPDITNRIHLGTLKDQDPRPSLLSKEPPSRRHREQTPPGVFGEIRLIMDVQPLGLQFCYGAKSTGADELRPCC